MLKDLQIELNKFDWSGVSGISDAIMVILTILLLLGLHQGSKSIKESALSRDADILRWAMAEMDKLKPLILLVTNKHKCKPYCDCNGEHNPDTEAKWEDDEIEAAQIVSLKLQRIGYMSLHNLISRDHFMNIWGPMYLSSWYAIESYVKHKRLELNEPLEISEGAYSRIYFEQYAKYCERHLPLMLVENERERFNLPPLPKEKTSKYGLFKSRLSSKEKLHIKRKGF